MEPPYPEQYGTYDRYHRYRHRPHGYFPDINATIVIGGDMVKGSADLVFEVYHSHESRSTTPPDTSRIATTVVRTGFAFSPARAR